MVTALTGPESNQPGSFSAIDPGATRRYIFDRIHKTLTVGEAIGISFSLICGSPTSTFGLWPLFR